MSDLPPAEGSLDRPYVENPYTALLKSVGWSGGFTVGANLRVEGADGDITDAVFLQGSKGWTEAKTLTGPRTIYDIRAGAFGNPTNRIDADGKPISTPTFVLAGGATVFGGGPLGFLYVAWIETTTDGGKTWTRSYEAEQSFVVAIVYDKTNEIFYSQTTANADGGNDWVWQVMQSRDGMSWDIVETAPGGPGNNQYASPIMTAAADPIYQDGNENNCPGGVYGYNAATKILMAPYPDIVAFAYEARFSAPQIQIRQEDERGHKTFTYIDIPGMDRVFSAAYAGGVWLAAGSGDTALIATSTDDGKTWVATYTAGPYGSAVRVALAASGSEPSPP